MILLTQYYSLQASQLAILNNFGTHTILRTMIFILHWLEEQTISIRSSVSQFQQLGMSVP